jgi:hypothetical protein
MKYAAVPLTLSNVLAVAVAAGFVWSVALFFTAVFVKERRQDAGFGWALAGAVLYLVVFADRLPGSPMWLREPVRLMPGHQAGSEFFASSIAALVILLAIYLFRVAVFYELFIKADEDPTGESVENLLNDAVAPVLSYVCFAICFICLIQPVYGLELAGTVLLIALMIGIYFWRVIYRLFPYVENLWTFFVYWVAKVRIGLDRAMVRMIAKIHWIEKLRREGGGWESSAWVEDRNRKLDEMEVAALERRREVFENATRPSSSNPDVGRGGSR